MGKYAELLEHCIRNKFSADDFIARCVEEGLPVEQKAQHRELYETLRKLDAKNQNGIWARIIKNAFAPLFVGHVDYVVGNPPWIRYGYLPREYRNQTSYLWEEYGLFSLKGYEARLGSGEKDFSQLFTYVAIDQYLKDGGLLGFLITQSVFRAGGQSEGFRRFRLGKGKEFKVLHVTDLARIKPFEAAANLTTAFVCKKGKATTYPLKYTEWRLKPGYSIAPETPLSEVLPRLVINDYEAAPVGEKGHTRWAISDPRVGHVSGKLARASAYRAKIGARTDPYGVFQLRILRKQPRNLLMVENVAGAGKRELEIYQCVIEDEFVYPLIRGKDARKWFASSPLYVLMVQDPKKRIGYSEKWMKVKYPKTYSYLFHFRDDLLARESGAVKELMAKGAFYSMFAISEDTFSPYKVIWPRMGTKIRASVVSKRNDPFLGEKSLIPCDTVTFVPFESSDEAHYFCACMNSAPVQYWIASFSPGGRGFGSPSVLKNVGISKYNPLRALHRKLVKLSRACHRTAEKHPKSLSGYETRIDELTAKLWGITDKELRAIQKALKETERPRLSRKTEGRVSEENAPYGTEESEDKSEED
jgi:hypothetical protein